MSPVESSYPMTAGPDYFKIAETQLKHRKTKYMKMREVLKEEMITKIAQIKKLEEINKSLKESKEENKQLKEIAIKLFKTWKWK